LDKKPTATPVKTTEKSVSPPKPESKTKETPKIAGVAQPKVPEKTAKDI